jgi:pimeloyl-ACP methyl ester carboxylesterase
VATADIDGILTHYELLGAGPPILMFSPGGFDATIEKWSTQGIYARIRPLVHLAREFTCIVFDRRESGESGGRVEQITWEDYAAQGKGLLDHLKIPRAHVLGACMGCCPGMAFGVAHPRTTASMVLYWPVGGAAYRLNSHARFNQHLAYVDHEGLSGVVSLAKQEAATFNQDARGGPWVSVLRRDAAFADAYARRDVGEYKTLVSGMANGLFDRDTAPGATPEQLMQLDIPSYIVPGHDKTHATSAARYLEECLPRSEYWDVSVDGQTEDTVLPRLIDFLDRHAVSA